MPIPTTSIPQLEDHLRHLGVAPGKSLAVHSNLITFGKITGGIETLFQMLKDLVGESGTLIFPSYTLNLGGEDLFNPMTTPSSGMGTLSEFARRSGEMKRTHSPTHSHLITGAKTEALMHGDATCSLGPGSDFELMHNENVELLLLGCTFHQGATFIHHVEAMKGVPYREWILLPRRIQHTDGTIQDIKVHYYGRISGVPLKTNLISVENEISTRAIGHRVSINGGCSYRLSFSDLYNVVSDMIENNPRGLMTSTNNAIDIN